MATASANYKDKKRRATRVLRQQAERERTHGDDVDDGTSDTFGATACTNRQTTRTTAHLDFGI